jgi:hypothetical protein
MAASTSLSLCVVRYAPRTSSFAIATATWAIVGCGGGATTRPVAAPAPPGPPPAVAPPAPIPIAAPEVAPAPSSCEAFRRPPPDEATAKSACADATAALATLATAAVADDDAAAGDALASLATCERLPTLLPELVWAERAPIACAESILAPVLDAKGRDALPAQLATARALVAASRLARLRPKAHAFDELARAEVEPSAGARATELVVAWKEALERAEVEAAALSKGAPSEIGAIARFEAAAAWLAFAKELRATPFPTELAAQKGKDPDLEVRYFAKLDEVTMPVAEHARGLATQGLGIAARDGILVKTLPSFQAILPPFQSRPGFEIRRTRDLELLTTSPKPGGTASEAAAVRLAIRLPPWATYAALERAAPALLLEPAVARALAGQRGIPAALRQQLERETDPKAKKDPKAAADPKKKAEIGSALVLARLRVALTYGSRPDAEAAAAWTAAKAPEDLLRVAIAKALLGREPKRDADPKKSGEDPTTAIRGYSLEPLDALAKRPAPLGPAAVFDAALLALDAAQTFTGPTADPLAPPPDPRKAYDEAIARLEAATKLGGLEAVRIDQARALLDGARESRKLLDAPQKPSKPTKSP